MSLSHSRGSSPPRGFAISGTSRSPEGLSRIAALGHAPHLFNDTTALAPEALKTVTHLLISIPPGPAGDPALQRHQSAIAALNGQLVWTGYLSTTGVYGDRGGDWVDETAPLEPTTARGAKRVASEAEWRALSRDHGLPLHIFRLAGIYGPGRNQLEALRNGTARRIVKPGQVFSRIHVADAAGILAASIAAAPQHSIYNVCDDEPCPPQDVVAYAAQLLGVEPPAEEPFAAASATLSDMALSFYAEFEAGLQPPREGRTCL